MNMDKYTHLSKATLLREMRRRGYHNLDWYNRKFTTEELREELRAEGIFTSVVKGREQ